MTVPIALHTQTSANARKAIEVKEREYEDKALEEASALVPVLEVVTLVEVLVDDEELLVELVPFRRSALRCLYQEHGEKVD